MQAGNRVDPRDAGAMWEIRAVVHTSKSSPRPPAYARQVESGAPRCWQLRRMSGEKVGVMSNK